MMRHTKTHFFILAICMAAATAACSDDGIVQPTDHGACTIAVDSSPGITIMSRADKDDDENPEFYMGTTRFYFYTSSATNVASVCSKTIDINAYNSSTKTFSLSDSEIKRIFGASSTECCVYAVSNLPDNITISSNPTISELKAIEVSTDFVNSVVSSFVMDGTGTITLDRDASTMSGSVSMQRAAAKITLDVAIKDKIEIENEIYEPIIDDDHKIYATLYNCATSGLVDGTLQSATRDTGSGYKKVYSANGTATYDDVAYDVFSHETFYTYPAAWGTDDDTDIHVSLAISWKKTDTKSNTVSYVTYNYQVPINVANKIIERNHHYKISLKVGVISSEVEGESSVIDAKGLSYEIAEWTNDGTVINAILTRSHYLMVADNSYTLIGQSKLTFQYQTCHEARAYLVSVCFNATRYGNQLAYLYNSTFDEETQSYAEVSADGYSDTDTKLRNKYTSVSEYIAANYISGESCAMLGNDIFFDNSSGEYIGTITFNAEIDALASTVFRPLTYTIALVNNPEHKTGRQLITITQYPSKYVEYGASGSVFVNGYYANIDGNYSFNFTPYNYTEESTKTYYRTSNNDNIYMPDNNASGIPFIYGGFLSFGSNTTEYVGTSYEVLKKELPTYTNNFKYTIDVHVSAFTKSDHTFSIKVNDAMQTRSYKIGDPRIIAGYTNNNNHSGNYVYTGSDIYEYYTSGEHPGNSSFYYHYVEKWPDVDKIKIANTNEDGEDVIAPYFKVQSNYGNAYGGLYFEVAQKRCATYQEVGYPAGRWRLPTLGEIAFIMHLQEKGAIDNYFIPGNRTGYWTASGGKVVVGTRSDADEGETESTSGTGTAASGGGTATSGGTAATGGGTGGGTGGTSGTGTSSEIAEENLFYPHYQPHPKKLSDSDSEDVSACPYVRCVYDLWYWGNTPESTTEFHPMPTKNSAKSAKRRTRR